VLGGGLEGVFREAVLEKGAVPGVFTAIQQKCLSLASGNLQSASMEKSEDLYLLQTAVSLTLSF